MQPSFYNFSIFNRLDSRQPTCYPFIMNPLVQARHKRGLSQQDLATVTGFTRQLIQRYESGRSNRAPVELCSYFDLMDELPLGTHAIAYMRYIAERRDRLPLARLSEILHQENVPARSLRALRQCIEDLSDVRPEDLQGHAKQYNTLSDAYFVASTMHVHPYSLQKWQENGKVPAVLAEITFQSKQPSKASQ